MNSDPTPICRALVRRYMQLQEVANVKFYPEGEFTKLWIPEEEINGNLISIKQAEEFADILTKKINFPYNPDYKFHGIHKRKGKDACKFIVDRRVDMMGGYYITFPREAFSCLLRDEVRAQKVEKDLLRIQDVL